ncbi:DEAD/DEAH box helicase [Reticulomyxa filosa]|uniref:RNA helicase n=1 Tax=Reticulomyxa filosa TaxID=46433 RepID=X6NSH3_RETFI|nr:DEAD/DEAH box helicase [Reticulomyxa filosa]|eukprot:ETO29245.1 DEAD/DEAH box helicase [Reticulomyxa filosa]
MIYKFQRLALTKSQYVEASVEAALKIHQSKPPDGHILVFLTGQDEIDRACSLLGKRLDELELNGVNMPDVVILPAYAALSPEKQQMIFAKVPNNCRKIIFATNIAETSLTVDGVAYVIDPGLVKQKRFNPLTGMDALVIVNISRVAALQRLGRAGRTKEGECYRLYTTQEFEKEFPLETEPEIQRTNLCSTVLTLKSIGIDDPVKFQYLDRPSEEAIIEALVELYLLNCIDSTGKITDVGKQISEFPLHPIFGKILIESVAHHCVEAALVVVSMASAGGEEVFVNPGRNAPAEVMDRAYKARVKFESRYGDPITWLLTFSDYMSEEQKWKEEKNPSKELKAVLHEWCQNKFVKYRILERARDIKHQLKEIMIKMFNEKDLEKTTIKQIKHVRKCLSKALFMQSALKIDERHDREGTTTKQHIPFKPTRCKTNLCLFTHPVLYHKLTKYNGLCLLDRIRLDQI